MEISETRMRDSILRAAGASELFSNTISLGNNAWNENLALTTEANKKYETTASQIEIAKNNINAIAIANAVPNPIFAAKSKVKQNFFLFLHPACTRGKNMV